MKKFSLKALGAAILSIGLVIAGTTLPAQAATFVSPSVTVPSAISAGAVTVPLTVSVTTVGAANKFSVQLPAGWTTSITSAPTCSGVTYTGMSNVGCTVTTVNSTVLIDFEPASSIGANTAITLTFLANTLVANSAVDFFLQTLQPGPVDTATVNLTVASSGNTVTFDSNGGSGAMADQTASSATSLSANAFTRSGYSFTGWNTAADGSGTAYADGASYAFTANTTLYAQWTATLATTGFNSAPYLFSGLGLAAIGGAFLLIARRKRSS